VPDFRSFPSTMWTLIEQARQGNSSAVNEFIARYRPAVVTFVARQGFDAHLAEDLAQEAFLALLQRDALARVEKEGGKFRSWMIGVTRNVIGNHLKRERAEKRGGGEAPLPLDAVAMLAAGAAPSDGAFDSLWVMNLLARAMARLRDESARRGTPYAEALRLVVEEGTDYRAAAGRLGKREGDVRNYVHRARALLADYLREEVAGYTCDPADYEAEVSWLDRLLKHKQAGSASQQAGSASHQAGRGSTDGASR